jgi:hypothetical protein
MRFRASLFCFLLSVSVGFTVTLGLAQSQGPDVTALSRCPVTVPNGNEPPSSDPLSRLPPWMAERNREGDSLVLPTPHGLPSSFHGNGKLWTILSPNKARRWPGLNQDGAPELEMDINWVKGIRGILTIKGRRLDGPTGPLHAMHIGWSGAGSARPAPWADGISHVTTGVFFPSEGCWEITGKIDDIDDSELTFVVEVRVLR